jgi:hypothetical protein
MALKAIFNGLPQIELKEDSKSNAGFFSWPKELIEALLSKMKIPEICATSATCRYFYVITKGDAVWKPILARFFPEGLRECASEQNVSIFKAYQIFKAYYDRGITNNLCSEVFTSQKIAVGEFRCFAITSEKEIVISSGKKIKLCSKNGVVLKEFKPFKAKISRLVVLPNRQILIGFAGKTRFSVLNLDSSEKITFKRKAKILNEEEENLVFALPTRRDQVITIYLDKKVIVWDSKTQKRVKEFRITTKEGISSAVLTPDESCLITGYHSGKIAIWDFLNAKQLSDEPYTFLSEKNGRVESLIFSKKGHLVVARRIRQCSELFIYDLKSKMLLKRIETTGYGFDFISSHEDLLLAYCAGIREGKKIEIYDLNEGILKQDYPISSWYQIFMEEGQLYLDSTKDRKVIEICDFSVPILKFLKKVAQDCREQKIFDETKFIKVSIETRNEIYKLSGEKDEFDALEPEKKAEKIQEYLSWFSK